MRLDAAPSPPLNPVFFCVKERLRNSSISEEMPQTAHYIWWQGTALFRP